MKHATVKGEYKIVVYYSKKACLTNNCICNWDWERERERICGRENNKKWKIKERKKDEKGKKEKEKEVSWGVIHVGIGGEKHSSWEVEWKAKGRRCLSSREFCTCFWPTWPHLRCVCAPRAYQELSRWFTRPPAAAPRSPYCDVFTLELHLPAACSPSLGILA